MGFIVVLFLSYLTYAEPVIIDGKQNRTVDNLANGLYWAIVSLYQVISILELSFKLDSRGRLEGSYMLLPRRIKNNYISNGARRADSLCLFQNRHL